MESGADIEPPSGAKRATEASRGFCDANDALFVDGHSRSRPFVELRDTTGKHALRIGQASLLDGALDDLCEQMKSPSRGRDITAWTRIRVDGGNRAAMRALDAGVGIRDRAPHAKRHARRGPKLSVNAPRREKDELLSADADSVPVSERNPPLERPPVELSAVAAFEVFDRRLRPGEVDANVTSGEHRIVDGHVTHGPTADDHLIASEIDLLKMKAQPIAHIRLPRVPQTNEAIVAV